MSRKRPSSVQGNSAISDQQLHGGDDCDTEEYVTYEYYRPGCYCTPQTQVVRHATPFSCVHHSPQPQQQPPQSMPVPWSQCCNTATYVVDAYGMVYYLSDFEHQLQLPGAGLALATEVTYHYGFDKDEMADMEDDEEDGVSPRKRERFEDDEDECEDDDNDEETIKRKKPGSNVIKTIDNTDDGDRDVGERGNGNVYRTEQGYLVEEPSDTVMLKTK